jgi:hypothetical protein
VSQDSDELRRLRNQVANLEDEKRELEGRFGFATQEIGYLRAKLQTLRPTLQTAMPGTRHVVVEPVTEEELAAALEVLRRVRPLPLAS